MSTLAKPRIQKPAQRPLSMKVDVEVAEALRDMSYETRTPQTKLLRIAIREFLERNRRE